MITIYKYELHAKLGESEIVGVPAGSKPVHVGLDPNGIRSVWMEVETTQPKVNMPVWIFGTGHEIPSHPSLQYFGSIHDRIFIWHVFFRA